MAFLSLNRPEFLNAIDEDMAQALCDLLGRCAKDEQIRSVVVRGAGRAFSAGGDVKTMLEALETGDDRHLSRLMNALHQAARRLRKIHKPVVASINGVAAGAGLGIALACDIRIASQSARFIPAFTKIGICPDTGVTYNLPRLVGEGKALELCLTNQPISATEAFALGLVSQVVADEELPSATDKLAETLSNAAPLAIARTKALIHGCWRREFASQLRIEMLANNWLAKSSDFREGLEAFVGKREARFTGR